MYIYKIGLAYINSIGASKATPNNWWRISKGPRYVVGAMYVGCNVQNVLSAHRLLLHVNFVLEG